MTVERPPLPTDERLPAWRRACLAYREWRQAGAGHQEAYEAAVAAVQTVLWHDALCTNPQLPSDVVIADMLKCAVVLEALKDEPSVGR
jgi:hypothetical protein